MARRFRCAKTCSIVPPSGRRCQWMAQQSSLTVLEEMQAARREAA